MLIGGKHLIRVKGPEERSAACYLVETVTQEWLADILEWEKINAGNYSAQVMEGSESETERTRDREGGRGTDGEVIQSIPSFGSIGGKTGTHTHTHIQK